VTPDFSAKARELCGCELCKTGPCAKSNRIAAALREVHDAAIEAALAECWKKTGRIVRTQTGHGLATEPRSLLEIEDGIRALKVSR
jgi:hypothetical protein